MRVTIAFVFLSYSMLLAGCADEHDVAAIQTQITALKTEQAGIRRTAERALAAAKSAGDKAASAEVQADRAAAAAEAASAKLDRLLASRGIVQRTADTSRRGADCPAKRPEAATASVDSSARTRPPAVAAWGACPAGPQESDGPVRKTPGAALF